MLWLPDRKELAYFDVRIEHEPLDAYRADFADAPPHRLVGEATPTYLHWPGALEHIADSVPEVRLIAVLRDPVARAWSQYWYNRTARMVESRPPHVAFEENPRGYLEPGRYAAHLDRLLEHFAREQLLVLTLDEMVADPVETFRSVCRHLGVAEVVPPDVGRPRNQAYAVRWPFLRRQMLRFRLWKRLPFRLGHRLEAWNRAPLQVPPLPPELASSLRAVFAEDEAALERLLGRPLPWRSGRSAEQSGAGPS